VRRTPTGRCDCGVSVQGPPQLAGWGPHLCGTNSQQTPCAHSQSRQWVTPHRVSDSRPVTHAAAAGSKRQHPATPAGWQLSCGSGVCRWLGWVLPCAGHCVASLRVTPLGAAACSMAGGHWCAHVALCFMAAQGLRRAHVLGRHNGGVVVKPPSQLSQNGRCVQICGGKAPWPRPPLVGCVTGPSSTAGMLLLPPVPQQLHLCVCGRPLHGLHCAFHKKLD
jgi:hypothetical protein